MYTIITFYVPPFPILIFRKLAANYFLSIFCTIYICLLASTLYRFVFNLLLFKVNFHTQQKAHAASQFVKHTGNFFSLYAMSLHHYKCKSYILFQHASPILHAQKNHNRKHCGGGGFDNNTFCLYKGVVDLCIAGQVPSSRTTSFSLKLHFHLSFLKLTFFFFTHCYTEYIYIYIFIFTLLY